MGEVNHAVIPKRSTVVDSHDNASAIAQIGDPHLCSEGQGSMGSGQGSLAEAFTTGGGSSVEPWAVPARSALHHLDQSARG